MRVQGGPEDAGERRAAQEGSEQLMRAQGSADQPKEGSRGLKAAEESSVLVLVLVLVRVGAFPPGAIV